jgi:hypothetical protein
MKNSVKLLDLEGRDYEKALSEVIKNAKPIRNRNWSPKEIDTLTKLYPHLSVREISKYLNRSVGGVSRKAQLLGLSRN